MRRIEASRSPRLPPRQVSRLAHDPLDPYPARRKPGKRQRGSDARKAGCDTFVLKPDLNGLLSWQQQIDETIAGFGSDASIIDAPGCVLPCVTPAPPTAPMVAGRQHDLARAVIVEQGKAKKLPRR